ncbi:MAG TPA: hypothetical protein DCL57_01180 [Microbacterium sp.]|nr:hypothetical protein [Microbacterium sp.]
MMWPGYGMGLGLGWLWVVLVLVGFALLIYVAIRVGTRSPDATGAPPTPAGPQSGTPAGGEAARRILEERLARGEIDVDEVTERMRALSDG